MFNEYTTVRELPSEGVVLVGEEHRNSRCAELAREVLDYYDPPTVAVENHTPLAGNRGHSAMREVAAFASANDIPQVAIDENTRTLWHGVNRRQLLQDANEFSHPILEDGDLDPRAITDARERIVEEYGNRISKEMYEYRERLMAARLRHAAREFPNPIVAAVGTFHINALAEYLTQRNWSLGLDNSRVSQSARGAVS